MGSQKQATIVTCSFSICFMIIFNKQFFKGSDETDDGNDDNDNENDSVKAVIVSDPSQLMLTIRITRIKTM